MRHSGKGKEECNPRYHILFLGVRDLEKDVFELPWFLGADGNKFRGVFQHLSYSGDLPAMHERYNFIAEILGIVILFIIPKTIVLLIPLNLISIATYGSYLLTGGSSTHLQLLSVINGAVLLGYLLFLQKKMTGNHEAWLLK